MTRIIALTDAGLALAERLVAQLDNAQVWFKPSPFAESIQQAFTKGERLIFICATGIVMRALAPVLVSKHDDPPVLVLDEMGRFVVPLLSGHEGGANEWGRGVAQNLGAQLVLTTANTYLKPLYTVGMGCERNCPLPELKTLLTACLDEISLETCQLSALASIDIKFDEVGLIELAQELALPFQTWSKEQLREVEAQLSVKSDYVYETVGVYGVAESAALYAAKALSDSPAELVLTKQKTAKATCAIARAYTGKVDTHNEQPSVSR